ncbi:hypothetical protein B0F90DRAFT_141101 [Multifurca ochricompacta]|uniref:Uncharacterized protein n=1 Tax=Multifurca ochricompacta TaxID=376703 RepID=A0AAD4QU72_9AGAM|nr:hypothetical protein B0F90DRAFT_141101 [Multifurca ochricompacta]
MIPLPPPDRPIEYGNTSSFWVEYPSGLIDLTRTTHLPADEAKVIDAPPLAPGQLDIPVDGEVRQKSVRINVAASAYVIIDMQKYVRSPQLGSPACVADIRPPLPLKKKQKQKQKAISFIRIFGTIPQVLPA